MISRKQVTAYVQRERAAHEAAEVAAGEALTPYQKLLRAAEDGRFEALVRQARPAEPVAMITPQEREAELRAQGRWPESKPSPKPSSKPAPQPAPAAEPPAAALTPNEQYLAQHCRWRERGPHDDAHRPRRACLTDYDPLADEE